MGSPTMHDATLVTTLGRAPEQQHGIVNPPVYHASTVLFPTVAALEAARPHRSIYYGRYGTPTSHALQDALARLEGGFDSFVVGSGKAAITSTLLALLKAGDHLLDRRFGLRPHPALRRPHARAASAIETTYYDPLVGHGIGELIRPETRVVFCESPGSVTFEVQDCPGDRRGRARSRRRGDHRQHLGHAPSTSSSFAHGADIVDPGRRPSMSAATPT